MQVEIRVPRRRTEGVLVEVFAQVLRGGLRQQPVDGLPLREDLQGGEFAGSPASDHPGGIEGAEETSRTAGASWPKGLED